MFVKPFITLEGPRGAQVYFDRTRKQHDAILTQETAEGEISRREKIKT